MIGHAIASLTVRYLAWPFAFYLTAVIGGLVCLNWMFYATDRPDMHTRAVLDQEHLYIEAAIGPLVSKDKVSGGRSHCGIKSQLIDDLYRNPSPI